MTYLRSFIDACEGYGWSGGPEFNTRVVQLINGRERRNANWSQPRHRYTLPFLNIDKVRYRNIRQMFEVCQAKLHSFLYMDPLSHTADNQLFGLGNGMDVQFQLSTLSIVDGVTYSRQVNALYIPAENGDGIPSVITVTVSGTPTAVSIDYDRGRVVFGSPPANGAPLRWTGEYAVWTRFDNDWLPFSIDSQNHSGYAHNGSIDLIELPPPEEPET